MSQTIRLVRPQRFGGFGAEGFGATARPDYQWTTTIHDDVARAAAQQVVRFLYAHYLNRSGAQADAADVTHWTNQIISHGAAGAVFAEDAFRAEAVKDGIHTTESLPARQYTVAQTPSQQRPDLAAVITRFFSRYLHRTGAQVDQAGLEFWTGVAINNGASGLADAERGFRVEAVNDQVYTAADLPTPEYFSLNTNVEPVDDEDEEPVVVPPGGTVPVVEGGILDGLLDKIGGFFDQIAESTGIEKNVLQIGAVGLVIGGLWWANSGSTRKR